MEHETVTKTRMQFCKHTYTVRDMSKYEHGVVITAKEEEERGYRTKDNRVASDD